MEPRLLLTDLSDAEVSRAASRFLVVADLPFTLIMVDRAHGSPATVTLRFTAHAEANPLAYACPDTWTIADMECGVRKHLEEVEL
jgi:hypothetical protein